jgi:hypothetical protein
LQVFEHVLLSMRSPSSHSSPTSSRPSPHTVIGGSPVLELPTETETAVSVDGAVVSVVAVVVVVEVEVEGSTVVSGLTVVSGSIVVGPTPVSVSPVVVPVPPIDTVPLLSVVAVVGPPVVGTEVPGSVIGRVGEVVPEAVIVVVPSSPHPARVTARTGSDRRPMRMTNTLSTSGGSTLMDWVYPPAFGA